MVFDRTGDDPLNSQILDTAFDGGIDGFGATGREEDFADRCFQVIGHRLAGLFDGRSGFPTFGMNARGVAKAGGKPGSHGLKHLRTDGCGGGVVNVDHDNTFFTSSTRVCAAGWLGASA